MPATTTEIDTTTTTNTVVLATPTNFYAACDANNLVTHANGGHSIAYTDYGMDFTYQQAVLDSTTAYECCNICQRTEDCQLSVYEGGSCVYVIRDTCHPGTTYQSRTDGSFDTFYTTPSEDDYPLTISNGPCGTINNGGDFVPPSAT